MRDESRSGIVKRNIFYSFGVKIFSAAVSFLLIPLTIDYVSEELYGIWLTLATIVGWIGIFDLGFDNGLRNKLAESIANQDWEKARALVSTSYFFIGILFFILSVICLVVIPYIPWYSVLNVPVSYNIMLIDVMRIIIATFAIRMTLKIQSTVLIAMQKVGVSSFVDALGQFLVLILVLLLTKYANPSLIYLAYAISLCPIIVLLISSFVLYNRAGRLLSPNIKYIKSNLVNEVLSLGVEFFIIQIATLVMYQTINVIISNVSGPVSVTEYNVVYRYLSIPLIFITILTAPYWSAFTDAYTLKDYNWMKRSHSKLKMSFLICVLILLFLILVYPFAFHIWLGDEVHISFQMIIVVSLYLLTVMWNTIYSSLINGIGHIRLQLYVSLFMTVFNIPLAFYLGKIFSAPGVVLSVFLFNMVPAILLSIQLQKIVNKTAAGIWNK